MNLLCLILGLMIKTIAVPLTGNPFRNLLQMAVVYIHQPQTALPKDLLLVKQIFFKILMLILANVILRKIGKNSIVIDNSRHPAHFQCLGRHLHHTALTACLCHFPKIPVKLIGFRRGVDCIIMLLSYPYSVGSDDSRLPSRSLQKRTDHVCRGSLSLGSCNSDHQKLPGRIAEPGCRQKSQGLPALLCQNHRHIGRDRNRLFHHQHLHPRRKHLGNECMGVGLCPGYADKHSTRRCLPRIKNHLIHFHIQAALEPCIIQFP